MGRKKRETRKSRRKTYRNKPKRNRVTKRKTKRKRRTKRVQKKTHQNGGTDPMMMAPAGVEDPAPSSVEPESGKSESVFVPGLSGVPSVNLNVVLETGHMRNIYPTAKTPNRSELTLQSIKSSTIVMCHSEGFARVIYAFHYLLSSYCELSFSSDGTTDSYNLGDILTRWFNTSIPTKLIIISPYFSFYREQEEKGILPSDREEENIYIPKKNMMWIINELLARNTKIYLYRLKGDLQITNKARQLYMNSLVEKLGENVRDIPDVNHFIESNIESIIQLQQKIIKDIISEGD